MLLHRRNLLQRKAQGVDHEDALSDIDAIWLVELERDDEQGEEHQEATRVRT